MSFRTRLIVLLVSTPLVAFAIVGGLLGKAAAGEETYRHLRVFEDVVSLIKNNYVEEVDLDSVMDGAMHGLADGLDGDSAFLTPSEMASVEPGEATVGLELTRQYYLRVVSARDGSPAAQADIRTGDYVRAIDGRPTRRMSAHEGRRLLSGPAGSTVVLTVLRGSAADPREVELVREVPDPVAVTGRLVSGGVGLIRIAAFGDGSVAQLERTIGELTRTGATRLVIDLRDTAGGELVHGVDAARLFVGSGVLAEQVTRDRTVQTFEARQGDGALTLPVALLTTTGTSNAAEVFAVALQANERAEVVGERTLGRVGVQHLVKLPDGSGLWLTWAHFQGPGGQEIHGNGLTPTVEVERPDRDAESGPDAADPILEKALERLALERAA